VELEPYALRVWERSAAEADAPQPRLGPADAGAVARPPRGELLLFEAPFARGIVPAESTWLLLAPEPRRPASTACRVGEGRLQFELAKMNLELFEACVQQGRAGALLPCLDWLALARL
jgi:hypothetical protein